ncbi:MULTISPECIES: hypothetical protein [unclassified Streptomyces]|uniref:hypothetical protein n=1 Tax=unclassified Streptomyces TaxID=2593676 RepID=UPI0011614E3D|nr:hypothetical protein [Streptomyces sp. TSRI0281]
MNARVASWPETRVCAAVASPADLALIVNLRSFEQREEALIRISMKSPGVAVTERRLVLRQVKVYGRLMDESGWCVEVIPPDPRAADPGQRPADSVGTCCVYAYGTGPASSECRKPAGTSARATLDPSVRGGARIVNVIRPDRSRARPTYGNGGRELLGSHRESLGEVGRKCGVQAVGHCESGDDVDRAPGVGGLGVVSGPSAAMQQPASEAVVGRLVVVGHEAVPFFSGHLRAAREQLVP